MTATEVDLRRPDGQPAAIPAKIAYARTLAESGLLPAAYRKNPANILWAVEYGEMLGLSSMAAITGVHVIEGKPTASAGLISALVRRAGHKLRVRGDSGSATCQIIRADDPKYTFEVTFTLDDAKAAGLVGKDVWKKYAASMLKARAITQCARDACEEALFGLHYTPEELGADVDEDGVVLPCDADVVPEPATPDDDPWYVRPAPDDDDTGRVRQQPAQNGQRWADTALEQAATFKSEPAGQELWREASAAVLDGRCTPGEATHIKNLINARVADRRKQAATPILKPLAEDDPWRGKILEELASDEEARATIAEVQQLLGAGQLDDGRAKLLARAVIARFPKSVLAGDDDA
jgi:hypothetical protein